jgi:orotidine-5'-phosphate decarboxylase
MSIEVDHPADRLLDAIDRCGAPVCVGFDPVVDRLPESLRPAEPGDVCAAKSIEGFCEGLIEAVAGLIPCVKVQAACFERYRAPGVAAMHRVIERAKGHGLAVILDAKRGDIGISASHYAAGLMAAADWITVNGYLGADGIEPFVGESHGAMVLVRTSNPSGDSVQTLALGDGRTIAEAVAGLVARIGRASIGRRGYSAVGAVVGATDPDAAAHLRDIMPEQLFLVPGYGAQGGSIDDVLPCFGPEGRGALVTASRSVIYAFDPTDRSWVGSVRAAATAMAGELSRALAAC